MKSNTICEKNWKIFWRSRTRAPVRISLNFKSYEIKQMVSGEIMNVNIGVALTFQYEGAIIFA